MIYSICAADKKDVMVRAVAFDEVVHYIFEETEVFPKTKDEDFHYIHPKNIDMGKIKALKDNFETKYLVRCPDEESRDNVRIAIDGIFNLIENFDEIIFMQVDNGWETDMDNPSYWDNSKFFTDMFMIMTNYVFFENRTIPEAKEMTKNIFASFVEKAQADRGIMPKRKKGSIQ